MSVPKIQAFAVINYEGPIAGRAASDIIWECERKGFYVKFAGYYYVRKEKTVPVLTKGRNMYFSRDVYRKVCEQFGIPDDDKFRIVLIENGNEPKVCACTCKFNTRLMMKLIKKADEAVVASKDCEESKLEKIWDTLGKHDTVMLTVAASAVQSVLPLL